MQESRDLKVRVTNAGKNYPAPVGTVAKARWFGAGFPDYPWLFATDGEYTGFAAVSSGQFATIKAHLRALRDVSVAANGQSGKVVHEVTPDGQVYFGANADAGNTDETAKFPSIVALVWRWTGDDAFRDEMYPFAVRNLHYIYRELDADGDGWPEGLGNVETPGMGTEKLDNTVYTIRGLRDLADLAASKGDTATRTWATDKAADLEKRFEACLVERLGHPAVRRLAAGPRQRPGLPAPLDRGHARRGRAEAAGPAGRAAGLRGARPRTRRASRAALLHRRVRALPHRLRPHRPDRRHRGAGLRLGRLQRPGAAERVHAEHLDHGGGRGGARPDGRRASWSTTRPAARAPSSTRPSGSSRRDARDRPVTGLRQQPGQAVHRALDGAPGLGCLRRSCGRSCTTSWASPRTSVAAGRRRAAGAGRSAERLRTTRPAGLRCVDVRASRGRSVLRTVGPAERPLAAAHRCRAARREPVCSRCGWTAGPHATACVDTARGRTVVADGGSERGTSELVVRLR